LIFYSIPAPASTAPRSRFLLLFTAERLVWSGSEVHSLFGMSGSVRIAALGVGSQVCQRETFRGHAHHRSSNPDPVDDILRSNVGIEQLFGTDGWERYLEGFVKLAWMNQEREMEMPSDPQMIM